MNPEKQVCKLIEFYFGDSNLHQNGYMKKLVDQSAEGYVSLETLLSFNKLKALTTDLNVVQKAISGSSMLKLSRCENLVRRTKPFLPSEDIDHRTVYIENLPSDVTIDWVHKFVASECGNLGTVSYVSLPKFKSTGDAKGFAFIELSTIEAVNLLCEKFSPDKASTGEPYNVGVFPSLGNKDVQRLEKQLDKKLSKRKNNRTKRKKKNTTENLPENEQTPVTTDQLIIVPKAKWEVAKTNYRKIQKEKFSLLKKQVKELKDNTKEETSPSQNTEVKKKEDKELNEIVENNVADTSIKLLPQTVLKINAEKEISSISKQSIKDLLDESIKPAYIDIKPNSDDVLGYIRFSSVQDTEMGKTMLSKQSSFVFQSLTASEESAYFEKVLKEKENIKNESENTIRKRSKKRKRGRDKILDQYDKLSTDEIHKAHNYSDPEKSKKARTHIRFDD